MNISKRSTKSSRSDFQMHMVSWFSLPTECATSWQQASSIKRKETSH